MSNMEEVQSVAVPSANEETSEIHKLKEQLAEITKKLDKVDKYVYPLKSDPYESSSTEDKAQVAGIKRLPMSKFKPQNYSDPEVWTHDVVIYYDEVHQKSDGELEDNPETVFTKPLRVQITSQALRDELTKVIGAKLNSSPTTFVHPFRPLLIRREELAKAVFDKRQKFHDVEAQLSAPATSVVGLDPPSAADEVEKKEKEKEKQVLVSLAALQDFVNTEMKDEFEYRAHVQGGKFKTIAHDNLWHLFQLGDLVLKRDRRAGQETLELYRVHCTSGGRPSLQPQKSRIASQRAVDPVYDPFSHPGAMDPITGNPPPARPSTLGRSSSRDDQLPFYISCHNFVYNGIQIGAKEVQLEIKGYVGERAISDLEVFPVEYYEKYDELLDKLKERGQHYLGLIKAQGAHKQYRGLAISPQQEIEGDIVIDFENLRNGFTISDLSAFYGVMANNSGTHEKYDCNATNCFSCTKNFDDALLDAELLNKWWDDHYSEVELIDPLKEEVPAERLALMTNVVGGYSLRDRAWYKLNIDQVEDIDYDDEKLQSFLDYVVMEDDKKNLLLALVDNHPSGRRQLVEDGGRPRDAAPQMDLIKGKGKGLIILLHGPPGVGKTLTAETIAMYTRRPLYAITCGDIGDTPKDIENSLDEHFRYAHKWGCVLLLDEADVFLAERKPGDIKRNAMVSVFLRVLEYYSGILFLTTNQVGRLDEAFKSRLRIPLHYPKIDRASTKQLWENHLNNIDRENIKRDVKITFNRPKLIDFALKHFDRNIKKDYTWNGRQVRNAFSTAIALAEYERLQNIRNQAVEDDVPEEQVMEKWYKTIKLTEEHFKKVSKTMKTFEKYLRSVRNDMTSADLMEQAQLRLDDWDPNAEPMHHEVKKNSGGIGGLSPNTPRTNGARRLSQAHTPSKKTTSHEAIGHKSESSDGESDSD